MENNWTEFSQFLSEKLAIPSEDLAVVLRHQKQSSDPLPMLLWQYGLISLGQLQAIFDWLDNQILFPFSS
jgi:hypothetical protein